VLTNLIGSTVPGAQRAANASNAAGGNSATRGCHGANGLGCHH